MHPVNTVFGPVAVPHPRWHRCECQTEGPKTFRPTAVWLRGRTSPELLYLETKWGSLIPFERVADLLKEVLPVGDSTNHETVREHLQGIAERMEARAGRRTASAILSSHGKRKRNNRCRMDLSAWGWMDATTWGRPTRPAGWR